MSTRHGDNYKRWLHRVNILTDHNPRFLPFKIQAVSDRIEDQRLEELVYIVGIFFTFAVIFMVKKPQMVIVKQKDEYGMVVKKLSYEKVISWSAISTAVVTVLLVLYNSC